MTRPADGIQMQYVITRDDGQPLTPAEVDAVHEAARIAEGLPNAGLFGGDA